jgi:hypothetical protein
MVVDPTHGRQPEASDRADWHSAPVRPYTVHMPLSREDRPVIVIATVAVVVAGLLVAAVLLLATGRGTTPERYEPFEAGAAKSIRQNLKDEGPFYVADPFGGNRSILFALEDGDIVALSNVVPNTRDCRVTIKNEGKAFVDCNGDRLRSTELARYVTSTRPSSNGTTLLYVDLRHKEPAPDSTGTAGN